MSERVEVGQIWADNVGETHAVVKVLTAVDSPAYGPPNGRRTRIRLDRFRPTSTGYRLISPAPSPDPRTEAAPGGGSL